MRVGITIDSDLDDALGLVRDNRLAWHLMEVLGRVARVDGVAIVNVRDGGLVPDGFGIGVQEALARCDLIIAAGGQIAAPAIRQFRARGGRHVLFWPGDPYTRIVEQSIFDDGADFGPVDCHDAVWIHDYVRDQAGLLAAIYRCPVHCLPFAWSPSFVEAHNRVHQDYGWRFAWQRPAGFCGPWACVINAGNASVKDMGVMALIAVNRFHVEHPGFLARIEFRNGTRIGDQLTFNYLAASLEVQVQGRLTMWSDQDYYGLLPLHGDFVTCHTSSCSPGYDQLDTLYAGYPLVHNVAALSELGYYYCENDIDQAVAMMTTMARGHDPDLTNVRKRLTRFRVDHADMINAYGVVVGAR